MKFPMLSDSIVQYALLLYLRFPDFIFLMIENRKLKHQSYDYILFVESDFCGL
ncbi:hypothetical protein I79_016769 [Cricetulus griseus]|uniref:Uncharacterized protein n=1 Tax=Cricetulus griseus TaxID=10029 RepID=G3I092_CRIGR|nr:hypothetical protein I79_016769 [Cricetulus griseus]